MADESIGGNDRTGESLNLKNENMHKKLLKSQRRIREQATLEREAAAARNAIKIRFLEEAEMKKAGRKIISSECVYCEKEITELDVKEKKVVGFRAGEQSNYFAHSTHLFRPNGQPVITCKAQVNKCVLNIRKKERESRPAAKAAK